MIETLNTPIDLVERVRHLAQQVAEGSITPEGSFDMEGAWKPSEEEVQPCCSRALRKASRYHPKVVYFHCLTIEHVSKRYEVPYRLLKAEVRKIREAMK